MKKIIMMMALIMSLVMSANAQTAIEKSKFFDNTYVGVNVGANTNLSFNSVFPLNSTVGVRVGKDLTPVFGLNIEGTAWFGSATIGGERFDVISKSSGHNAFRAVNVGLNGTINWSNLLLGYKGSPRTFEVSTVTGLGWGHVFTPSTTNNNATYAMNGLYSPNKGDYNTLTAKTGIDLNFNLGKTNAHTIYVEPAVLWSLTNGATGYVDKVQFNKRRAYLQIAVGYTYHFKTSNGTHYFKVWNVGDMQNDINALRAELAKKPKEVVKEVVKTLPTETVERTLTTDVTFAQNSYELTDEAKALLDKIATDATVNVIGTASPEGTQSRNEFLSTKRAEVVADYLKARGVKVKNVLGGADSRKAIVSIAEAK